MTRAIKTKIPGSILVRKTKTGKEYIYYKAYGEKGNYKALGLEFSNKNIKVAEKTLEHCYKEYLMKSNKIDDIPLHETNNNVYKILSEFIDANRSRGLTEQTLYEYRLSFDHIITEEYDLDSYNILYKNGRKIKQLTIEKDIISYVNTTTHNNNTINKHLRQFQLFVNFGAELGIISPVKFYKKYKKKQIPKEVVAYSIDEAKAILDFTQEKDEVFYLLIKLYYLTGGRLGEWLNAYFGEDPHNVDLENNIIRFRNKIRRDLYQTVPIFPELKEVLLRLKELEEERDDFKGKVVPYSATNKGLINKKLNRIERELGIKKKGRSTHGFRRLLATELFKNEVPIDIIKDVMRHSSIDVTLKAYREYDNDRVRKSMDGLKRG
jgi:integrase